MIKYTYWLITSRAEVVDGRRIAIRMDQITAFEEDADWTIIHMNNERIRINETFKTVQNKMSELQIVEG